jgi:CheY-like chemotaxis protein
LTSQTVLIVEDSLDLRDLLVKVFELGDIKVQCVSSCETAISTLQQAHELPALVIVDLVMPGMGGVEFIALIKKDERLRPIPVAIMSGNITPQARESGAAVFITKPFDIDAIIELAARFLNKNA